ncbi:Uncharacterised protein [Segatella copri]|nr:Uncharacterised protein [Segatella copri]
MKPLSTDMPAPVKNTSFFILSRFNYSYFLNLLLRMHKFSNFSANNIVLSEKNVIFALVLRTKSTF